jgi:hypothetical protein
MCERVYVRVMGTAAELKIDLSPSIRMHPSSMDRYLQDLAKNGIIARSGPGGGKANHHFNSWELASICLSFAAFTPGGAAAAAQALGGLFPENPGPGDASLVTSLAGIIEVYARDIQRGTTADRGNDDDWQLTLSLEPLFAVAALPHASRRYLDDPNNPKDRANEQAPTLRRQTILTKPLLMIVAGNYANTPNEGRRPGKGSASTP